MLLLFFLRGLRPHLAEACCFPSSSARRCVFLLCPPPMPAITTTFRREGLLAGPPAKDRGRPPAIEGCGELCELQLCPSPQELCKRKIKARSARKKFLEIGKKIPRPLKLAGVGSLSDNYRILCAAFPARCFCFFPVVDVPEGFSVPIVQ